MNWTKDITVTCEDNMELMARYPDSHFDLAIPDIEYGIGASKPSNKSGYVKQKNGEKTYLKAKEYIHSEWDFKKSGQDYFDSLFLVSKDQIIWGGNYYGLSGGFIVWDKLNGESDQFGCELAWNSMTNRTDVVYFMWAGMMQGVYCGRNLKKALKQQGNKKLNEKRIHETQKPVALYKWLLSEYGYNKGGSKKNILDTHGGSLSIAIACHDMGFKLTACEMDREKYQNAHKRFKEHISKPQLFTPEQQYTPTQLEIQ